MLMNFLKTAIRNITRDRYYAVIKISGLALGLGTTLVLFLYVSHELSYDTFHPDVDRLYRVNQTNIWDPNGGVFSSTGPAVAPALVSHYAEIESVLRINTPGSMTMRHTRTDGQVIAINEQYVLAADSNFFEFFAFPLKEGDARTSLVGKNKVVLSDEAAKRLFGDEPALGKMIQFGEQRETAEVTGVTQSQPSNAHFKFDYLFSMPTNPNVKEFEWSWIWTQVVTYVKLKQGVDGDIFGEKIKHAADQFAKVTFQRILMDYDEFKKEKGGWDLYLQPVKDIHLYSGNMGNRLGTTGDIQYVYIFSLVGIFILLIAIINFVNLSTARGASRAKEVGVKKTLGWRRSGLIAQFQVEHILITAVSMLLGLGVMELLRMIIQPVAGIEIPLNVWSGPMFFVVAIATPLVIGFLAGLYPSFYLTSFQPAQVLKGKLAGGFKTSGLRNALVVFQFTVSIALMASTVIVFQQLEFFQSRNLGFDKENIMLIRHAEKLGNQLRSFRDEMGALEGVKSAAASVDIRNSFEDIFMREGETMKLPINAVKIDDRFISTFKLNLVTGRSFDEDRPSDKDAVILNETTVKLFGWKPEEAIGKKIIYLGDEIGPQEIIGVVSDFNFQSLRQTIAPLMFMNLESNFYGDSRMLVIKFQTKDLPGLVQKIERRWNEISKGDPFEFSFYDEELKMQYQAEQRLGSLFSIFTGLSISIAVIGLIGLAAYSAEQRRKEIGIRKVFGASLTRIFLMMNTQYVKLMVVALLLATPLSWWAMQHWLETFAYKIEITPMVFIIAGCAELAIALLCVGYLALRAASLNPSEVLKEE
jgi:putative ABC transport system permease protein